jgi:hypothetical protein
MKMLHAFTNKALKVLSITKTAQNCGSKYFGVLLKKAEFLVLGW